MSENKYIPLKEAIDAIKVSGEIEAFCVEFNRAGHWHCHAWHDGTHLKIAIEGEGKTTRTCCASVGDWIVTTRGEEDVFSEADFCRRFLPVPASTIEALRK